MKLDWFFRHKAVTITAILVIVAGIFGIWLIIDVAENRRIDAEALTLKEDLTVEFNQPAKVSDFVANLNGEYVDDFTVDTTKLGPAEVQFEYINIKNKKRIANFNIEVVDTTAPVIYGLDTYSVPINYEGDLTNLMISGDNVDDHPTRKIVGDYDLAIPRAYKLEYAITDSSGNETKHPFTLNVYAPTNNHSPSTSTVATRLVIADVIQAYKTDQTNVGIDVSAWQGEINWQKVREAGVEFAFVRVGYQTDFGSEYTLDRFFTANIEGATRVGLPVGVYFYSCADSIDEAQRQADWVLEQVRGYELELGIAFDWEEWSDFNRAGMSFYTLGKVADAFIETVKAQGHEGLLYGSKNYLNRFWQNNTHPIWLAQYYDYPTYEKPFRFWQLADTGIVPGISGNVDLDVWYQE